MKNKLLQLFVLGVSLGANAQIPTTDLICYYPFTTNANNMSGTGNNHGTENNIIYVADRAGNPSSAIYLNNFDASIDFGDVPITTPNFTLSYWMAYNAISNGEVRLMSKRGACVAGNFFDISVSAHATNMECYADAGTSNLNSNAGETINPSEWIHVAYVVDSVGQETRKYINGVLESSKPWNGQAYTIDNAYSLILGYSSCIDGVTVRRYEGLFDDFRIYSAVLSAQEIESLASELDVTGLGEVAIELPSVYPNPANNELNIRFSETIESYEIYDLSGKMLLTGASTIVNLHDLSEGYYLIVMNTEQGVATERFQIIR